MSANVFISFASKDMKVATTLCAALESRGFSCWISARDIKPGENFQIAIVRAIRNAKMMLLVFTANSNASDEMSKELALASQQKLIVVPLRVEDVAPNEAFAYEFATRQWIDFFADWEAAINQLCVRLAQAMPPEPEEPLVEPIVLAPPTAVPTPAPPPPPVAVAPEPVPEVRPAVVAKAPAPPPPPAPPKSEPVAAKPAPAPEAKRPAEAKPTPAPTPTVKPAVPPAVAAKPAVGPAPAARKPPVGLFIGIGVAAVLVVGGLIALPMLSGKKPAPAAPLAATASPPSTASATPLSGATPSQAAPASAAAATLAANGAGAAQVDPAADSSALPAAAKPRIHKAHAAAHVAAKADVPY